MGTFLTRVELHSAIAADYERLHLAMAGFGFSRTIIADDSTRYALPTAEYVSQGEFTAEYTRELAKAAALSTGKTCSVISVIYTHAAWELPQL